MALAGFVVYELIRRWFLQQQAGPTFGGVGQVPGRTTLEPIGSVPGAAMTGGGEGAVQPTLGHDGSTVTERVGRGVVRRNAQPGQATQGA